MKQAAAQAKGERRTNEDAGGNAATASEKVLRRARELGLRRVGAPKKFQRLRGSGARKSEADERARHAGLEGMADAETTRERRERRRGLEKNESSSKRARGLRNPSLLWRQGEG